MDLKISDIIAIVIAIAIPVAVFAVLLVPGATGAVLGFVLDEGRRPYIFYGGALLAFGVLAFRLYRRIRPRPDKTSSER
ncbi:MAG TPA: hypothetical protein VFV70_00170 [Hyphomonadaceae bacterium]|nr:hypothetical protein [Hyphomonadaceae bacterium]